MKYTEDQVRVLEDHEGNMFVPGPLRVLGTLVARQVVRHSQRACVYSTILNVCIKSHPICKKAMSKGQL